MSELSQILGAIMRDITKARVTADLYTREVCKSYSEDNILQHFPIPRVDIRNMEIDLKLAISKTNSSLHVPYMESKLLYDDIYGFSTDLIKTFVEEYIRLLSTTSDIILLSISNLQEIKEKQGNSVYMRTFAKSVTKKLTSSMDGLISMSYDNKVIRNIFEDKLSEIIKRELVSSDFCKELEEILTKELISEGQKYKVKKLLEGYSHGIISNHLKKIIEAMSSKLSDIFDKENDQRVHVAVTTEELKDIPDSKLSSLRLSIDMQNYVISQVESQGKEDIIYSINPE